MSIIAEIRKELYGGLNPFDFAQRHYIDSGYPHTNIVPEVIEAVLIALQPSAWLEIGSMVGGSAIEVAKAADRLSMSTEIVCIDPFCADVAAWFHEALPGWTWKGRAKDGTPTEWRCLRIEDGRPTIYERFLANVAGGGHDKRIVPIPVTASVGTKLLQKLAAARRISALPSVIYLDSAHEPDETFLELILSWSILPAGGVLMGDDWGWEAVRNDVAKFAASVPGNPENASHMMTTLPKAVNQNGVMLYEGQWLLFK